VIKRYIYYMSHLRTFYKIMWKLRFIKIVLDLKIKRILFYIYHKNP